MSKIKRFSLSIFVLVLSLCCIATLFEVFFRKPSIEAHAAEIIFSDADYTNEDKLLLSNGTTSNKVIQTFAEEVIEAKDGTYFPELDQVLPKDFLESSVNNGVRQFYGKEYGYYIVKEGSCFDVLLVDFTYKELKNQNNDNEYIIQVKPLLQESFLREANGSGYIWSKYGGTRYKYYVAYPRFVTALKNENSFNYGDAGYVKANDDGLIIQQSRTNFGKVLYKTEKDWAEMQLQFMAESFVDMTVDSLDMVLEYFTGVGGVLGFIKDRVEHELELIEYSKEVIVKADNEVNICTNPSKSVQRDNGKDSYTRVVGFMPQKEIILSSDEDSYANFITLLDDTNYRSRLYQICEFDVVRRNGKYASMEHVAGNYYDETAPSLSFWKEQVLFDDQAPQPELNEEDFHESNIPLYLLPSGQQYFHFRPQYSSDYLFTIPSDLSITIDGADVIKKSACVYSAYLCGDNSYTIVIRNNTPHTVIGMLNCSFSQFDEQEFTINEKQSYILQYIPTESSYKSITSGNNYSRIRILDENFVVINDTGNRTSDYCYFREYDRYYILVENTTQYPIASRISFSTPKEMTINKTYTIDSQYKTVIFRNTFNDEIQFVFSLENNSAAVFNNSNKSIGYQSSIDQINTYTFALKPTEHCYIQFENTSINSSTTILAKEANYLWYVNGEYVTNLTQPLCSNEQYSIYLVSSINGSYLPISSTYILTKTSSNWSYINNTLCIKDTLIGKNEFVIYTLAVPESFLTVEVWDYKVKVTYKQENPDDNNASDFTENAIYNKPLPDIKSKVLSRTGYTFGGFYTERNGSGKLYYRNNYVGEICDKETAFTLYAYWIANEYDIILDWGYNNIYDTIKVCYDERVDIDSYFYHDNRVGYDFHGFFSGRNGTGIEYFGYEIILTNSHEVYSLISTQQIWTYASDGILYAYWTKIEIDYTYEIIIQDYNSQWGSIHLVHGSNVTITAPTIDGCDFVKMYVNGNEYETTTYQLNNVQLKRNLRYDSNDPESRSVFLWYPESLNSSINMGGLFMVYKKSKCIAEGTLITLANGNQVPVETLTGNERLLVWNLFTGQFDTAPILFIDKDALATYEVIKLAFSDGTTLNIISEHGLWDYNLNRYLYLDKNAASYIGHWFNKQTTDENGKMISIRVQLTGVTIVREQTITYSPVTYGHLCYYVNGMLSMPGGIDGLFNIFKVDADNMKYDTVSMEQDIQQYGLFTYEEFAQILSVPQEIFNAFNAQYFKVAIGKGLLSEERLAQLVERYAEQLGIN